ncbi:MAG: hypothetical protein PHT31_02145 [Candidatus Omnitrophica bacterium]|nr:hypothetical protein [Candidatus Omnitrophota bacterium]MDD5652949.1 hypothetical protein [Candidatus Omnitrophota bacterium]
MEKIRYEFDPYNRLTALNSALRGIRKVIDGQFKISGQNTLTYHIKSPVAKELKIPHQVKLKGIWSLTENHQLKITLDKSARQAFGDQVVLEGEIIDLRENSLLFAVTGRTKKGNFYIYGLELCGSWQADEHNRLNFKVKKEGGESDILIFEGAWEVNGRYQIVYNYRKENLVRKTKEVHSLLLRGKWQVVDKARLSYSLGIDSFSRFDFSAQAGIFKNNCIKYELGIGISGRKNPVRRTITFFGKWKVEKNIGLLFEIERQGKGIQSLVFGAQARLNDKNTVSLNLKNNFGEEVGAELELSRDIFSGDGQAFLRLLQSKKESAIMAGAGLKW